MAHLLQVGIGSGGVVVLDALARDPRVTRITIIEPDIYGPHNVHRHLFPQSGVGQLKAELAVEWVKERRPDVNVEALVADITDPAMLPTFEKFAAECDFGVCAVDNEPAKFAFDALMRKAGKPWTLGEVLSGGIGGWVHRFTPDGPCYGCVASHLKRNVAEEPNGPPPDYANPGGPITEARIHASKASIGAIASLHAVITQELMASGPGSVGWDKSSKSHHVSDEVGGTLKTLQDHGFTSLLFTLARVPGIFDDAYRAYRFRIAKSEACLICASIPAPAAGEDLDVALDQALARLGHE